MFETIYYKGFYIQAKYAIGEYYISIYPEIKEDTLRKAKLLVSKLIKLIPANQLPRGATP